VYCVEVEMLDEPRKRQPENDPVADLIEEWLRLREAQGWTREAAIADWNNAAEALRAAEVQSD
jgi:hypothetical protein